MEEKTLHANGSVELERIIRKYSKTVYRLAFARVGNSYDADEIYQEVFLRLIRKKPKFRDEEHEKAWLLKVTINCSKKFLGSAWNKKTMELTEDIPFQEPEYLNLYHELKKLPEKYRMVIHLFYYEQLSTIQIAQLLRRKESTVRTQLTRARQLLKGMIKEEDYV